MLATYSSARIIARFLVILGGSLACRDGTELTVAPAGAETARAELRRGIIELNGNLGGIDLPDTVTAGSSAAVTVATFGDRCTWKGPTETTVQGLLAVIEPFDSVLTRPGSTCASEFRLLEHRATVQFLEAGTATVKILGLQEPRGIPMTIERAIVVR